MKASKGKYIKKATAWHSIVVKGDNAAKKGVSKWVYIGAVLVAVLAGVALGGGSDSGGDDTVDDTGAVAVSW